MDGYPVPKNKTWGGHKYSETRYSVIKWLEKELSQIQGEVLNVASGAWPVPRQLLSNKVTKYVTYDMKFYGDSKNPADVIGDVHDMPQDWSNKWDCVLCNQAIECFKNPFKAMDELYRIIKPGGTLLIDGPFNYRWFGDEAWPSKPPKKHRVFDYWRISKDGWEELTNKFSKVIIEHSGPNVWDAYNFMIKAIK